MDISPEKLKEFQALASRLKNVDLPAAMEAGVKASLLEAGQDHLDGLIVTAFQSGVRRAVRDWLDANQTAVLEAVAKQIANTPR